MIVRGFWGAFIDLSKVVSVSDAYFVDMMGHGGYFAGFEIHCQLLQEPIKVTYTPGQLGVDWWIDGAAVDPRELVDALQERVDEFVEMWKGSKQ